MTATSLRILIILSQQPSETGSGVYLKEVVEELRELGHVPYLLAAHYRPLSNADFPSLSNEQIFTLIFSNHENAGDAEISFPIPGMSLDMPYLHVNFRDLTPEMLNEYRTAWLKKIWRVVDLIHPDIIHINHLWLLPGIVREVVSWVPVVATSHGTDYKLLVDAPAFKPLVLPGVQQLDAVMPVSGEIAHIVHTVFGVSSEKIQIVGNGHNHGLFFVRPPGSGRKELERLLSNFDVDLPGKKIVLCVGKFAGYKGVPYLIQAAKIYSPMYQNKVLTLIVGEGSPGAKAELERLIRELELERSVLLTGKVPYQAVSLLMNEADVYVMPSINEPFGLVLLEALACGVRSVAARRGGPAFFVPPVLLEKDLAHLVEPLALLEREQPDATDTQRYIADLASAIARQLSFPRDERDRQCIADAVKDQTWAARTKEIVEVYTSAIRWHHDATVQDRRLIVGD